jgi:hypothetical protein
MATGKLSVMIVQLHYLIIESYKYGAGSGNLAEVAGAISRNRRLVGGATQSLLFLCFGAVFVAFDVWCIIMKPNETVFFGTGKDLRTLRYFLFSANFCFAQESSFCACFLPIMRP